MQKKLFLPMVLALSTTVAFAAPGDLVGASSPLAITQATQIPGGTLKEGSYSITIVDNLSDRMIVRIDGTGDSKHSIFLAVPGSKARMEDGAAGPVLWSAGIGKVPAMRGFAFANGNRVEFVYPKAEAAALAKANSAKVLAVDPESEGHSPAIKNLTKDEMQVINLWMLSLTTTGADNKTPAVLAQRYVAPAPEQPVMAQSPVAPVVNPVPVQTASAEQPVTTQAVSGSGSSRPTRKRAVIAQLPHTGSFLPIVWMAGLLSFAGAFVVRFGRTLIYGKNAA